MPPLRVTALDTVPLASFGSLWAPAQPSLPLWPFVFRLFLCPENGGSRFLRNVANYLQRCYIPEDSNFHSHRRYSDWLRAGRPRGRSSSPGKGKTCLFSTSSRPVLGPTQPPIQWVPGALSQGVKRPGREADHSPTSAEVKKTWVYTSTPPYAFIA
jgi:hypothetical protein